ncbi:hypothetical protein M2311_001532 [Rhizobium leguminosarum]|jgi:hypothetical protein|nr:hypothetical protein [Rhizobium leguminosarum]MDH6271458.1 hypothetical protein [Rhizobium leguminosarum]
MNLPNACGTFGQGVQVAMDARNSTVETGIFWGQADLHDWDHLFNAAPRPPSHASLKIPALHLQRVDMKVRHEHVARDYNRLRLIPWIWPSAMGKLIAAAGRQFELFIAVCKADQVA